MTIPERSWYHLSHPVDVNPDWPEAHLYEVIDGIAPKTELTEPEHAEVIRVVRRDMAGQKWHPSLMLGYSGRVNVHLASGKKLSVVFLLVEDAAGMNRENAVSTKH